MLFRDYCARPAEISSLSKTVFSNAIHRPLTGHSGASNSFVSKEIAHSLASFISARFVQKAASQMKSKACVTASPLGRGLLLGRHAFLF
jgi:hypothetical protein